MKVTELLTIALFVWRFNITACTQSCLYGWYLSKDGKSCFIYCPISQQIIGNIYCNFDVLKSVSLSYNSSTNILSMPAAEKLNVKQPRIPPCFNVTLQKEQYEITFDGFVVIADHIMPISPRNVLSATRNNVTVCYPPTPQLLQCETVSVPFGSYEIVNQTTLNVFHAKSTAFLGDFYVDENQTALMCAESVVHKFNFVEISRCNMIALYQNDYRVNEDGSIKVLPANITIKAPVYSLNYSQFLLVCVPLSAAFLNCKDKEQIFQINYAELSNFNVLDRFYGQTLLPQQYYKSLNLEITACVADQKSLFAKFLKIVYQVFYFSGSTLVLTIILRIPMFMHNYHSLCLLFHVISLAAFYFVSGVRIFYTYVEFVPCYFIFGLSYFFIMATFLWLTVIAYDSWSYFSRLQTARNCACGAFDIFNGRFCCELPNKSLKRFVIYNVYAWGVALILTIIVLSINLAWPPFDFSFKYKPSILVPQRSLDHTTLSFCFFNDWNSVNAFYSFPLTVFAVLTLVFMVLTICILHQAGLGTELVNHRRRRQLFEISMKMFILMGFSWIISSICKFIGSSVFDTWFVSLTLTAIQGFIISIIYCVRKDAFNSVRSCCKNIFKC